MSKKLKIGYWLFGLSFILPSFDLSHWGIQIATECALSGVALLINGFPDMLFGAVMLCLFFINFSVLPGIEINKGLRITSMALAVIAGILPQEGRNGEMLFFVTTPPFLLWATSIVLINLEKMKKVEQVGSYNSSQAPRVGNEQDII